MLKRIVDSSLGMITIEDELILNLTNTKEFKRLARINHLGVANFLFPSATHTRLAHSLGVYELARRTLIELKVKLPSSTNRAILVAALCHDLGHGPISHGFEHYLNITHEKQSELIILSKETEVGKVLSKMDKKAQIEAAQLMSGNHKLTWANQLISSEIDVDRLDYLMRDSHSTGTNYGLVEWRWLIKNIQIVDNRLTFTEKGIQAVEAIILGRYHMNQVVYHNPKAEAFNALFNWMMYRFIQLFKEGKLVHKYPIFEPIFMKKDLTVDQFHNLDDHNLHCLIFSGQNYETDPLLNKLCADFRNQKIPQIFYHENEIQKLEKKSKADEKGLTWDVIEQPFDFRYYLARGNSEALIYTREKQVLPIRNVSTIFSTTMDSGNKKIKRLGFKQ
ncbi:MAG: HD domain-containing protein [Mycoplasmataceae bacterium]|nr:HD domain-containing protein [Mycoplasmataceae bacterium]